MRVRRALALAVAAWLLAACPGDGADPPPVGRDVVGLLPTEDVRPWSVHVAGNGDLAVWWEVTGVRDRDALRCAYPAVLTWVAREDWRRGVRPEAVRAWVVEDSVRFLTETRTGVHLTRSQCAHRARADQSPPLAVVDGRLVPARGPAPDLPPSPIRWRPNSYHISGTWSVDGGRTWNQFMDIWDATPLLKDGRVYAVKNGRRSWFGELEGGGHPREGFVEWFPWDVRTRHRLPPSDVGYRFWRTVPGGVLLGSGRRGAVYVSDGRDWGHVVRRSTEPCDQPASVSGRLLFCPVGHRAVRISADWGRTWTTTRLADVVPAGVSRPGQSSSR